MASYSTTMRQTTKSYKHIISEAVLSNTNGIWNENYTPGPRRGESVQAPTGCLRGRGQPMAGSEPSLLSPTENLVLPHRRGRGRSRAVSRPYVGSSVLVGDVESLTAGAPLESRKRRRKQLIGPATVRRQSDDTADGNRQPHTKAADATWQPSTEAADTGRQPPTDQHLQIAASHLSPSAENSPSPSLYFESGGSSDSSESVLMAPQTPQPSDMSSCYGLRDVDSNGIINIGSEDESEEDNHDVTPPPLIPRASRMFLETEEDPVYCKDEDSAYLVLQWPPPIPPQSPAGRVPTPVPESAPIGATMPIDLFHFEWKAFPGTPIPPEERRESFSIQNGPTIMYGDPYDAFSAIWDCRIMEHVALETNKYAQQVAAQLLAAGTLEPKSRITQWVDTDADELYRYFAIILATGIVVRSRFEEYWNSSRNIFSTPGFAVEMSSNRFLLLSRCLHFNDNLTLSREASHEEVKLHKLMPILEHLNNKFQSLYTLGQNVALDESLTQWKGWLDSNQLIKNKAASIGIKTLELCDSRTGYLWRFKVHTGGESVPGSEAGPVGGKIPSLVLGLTDDLKNSGRTLWMDNYYNSPALARALKSNGLDCVGTLRTNRQFVPVVLGNLTKRDMAVGQISGCTSGDVDLLLWRDNNRVALISTYHGASITYHDSTRKPTVIHDYNHCMGGMDKKDQMLAMYPIERKRTRVWYKKFFRRLLNASVLNSYILFNHPNTAQLHMKHRAFRMNLIVKILELHQPRRVAVSIPNRWLVPVRIPELGSPHKWRSLPFCNADQGRRKRRQCANCKKRTTHECVTCVRPYCPPCFTLVHNYAPVASE